MNTQKLINKCLGKNMKTIGNEKRVIPEKTYNCPKCGVKMNELGYGNDMIGITTEGYYSCPKCKEEYKMR